MAIHLLQNTWTAFNHMFDSIKEGIPPLEQEEFTIGQEEFPIRLNEFPLGQGKFPIEEEEFPIEQEEFPVGQEDDVTTGEVAPNNKYNKEIIFLRSKKVFWTEGHARSHYLS